MRNFIVSVPIITMRRILVIAPDVELAVQAVVERAITDPGLHSDEPLSLYVNPETQKLSYGVVDLGVAKEEAPPGPGELLQ